MLLSALYRGGRQVEALAVYTETRGLLEQKLGAGPSREGAELHLGRTDGGG
ncbi:BTAD domain-containing putative transcriptional regulator [Streptomyces rimosus]|uniref:BTAD domain-containing putative transcriptional regulator n=1 Tax=Streptomyces rimosus TaxID=1927 RepID=UPI00099BFCDB